MAKVKTSFFCKECGYESPKWLGKCPSCSNWNSFVEEVISKDDSKSPSGVKGFTAEPAKPRKLSEIDHESQPRLNCPDQELNRVLGGGIVPGSLVLIGGEPGIGKSTLLLQLGIGLQAKKVLYVSGEESGQQIKMRASRMSNGRNGMNDELMVLTETSTQKIFNHIESVKPDFLIIDSIQTLHSSYVESSAGSISQVRQSAGEMLKYAKESGTPVFLIGHITKDGSIAGPKLLEHMVDTVLQFEGDRHLTYRILRTTKNRFGSTSELGIYEMRDNGLREVSNPSEILITQRDQDSSGISIGATLEGNRPLLIEVQALVSPATYGTPQRSSTGFDAKRLNMLLAVLEKRGGYRLGVQDVFLNIAGGIRVEDPAIDLTVCAAVISSFLDKPITGKVSFAAEVGLDGELRGVNRIENRISEAEKLGFEQIYISTHNSKGLDKGRFKIDITPLSKLRQVVEHLF